MIIFTYTTSDYSFGECSATQHYADTDTLNRPNLKKLFNDIENDEVCVLVPSMDELAVDLKDLIDKITFLSEKSITLKFLKEHCCLACSAHTVLLLKSILSFEKDTLLRKQRQGIDRARQQGKYKGRISILTPAVISDLEKLLKKRDKNTKKGSKRSNKHSYQKIADQLGISVSTLYRYLKKSH